VLLFGFRDTVEKKAHLLPPSNFYDEADLIRAAQRGDATAFSRLIERHHGAVRAYLVTRMPDAAEAEDLAQEIFLTAFHRLPGIEISVSLGAWLRGVAAKLLANHRRKFRAQPIGLNAELQTLIDGRIEDVSGAGRESARMDALRECLGLLDGPARQLVRERYGDGASLADLAVALGRKTSAISMQLHRLRAILAICIAEKLAASES
jgi:RNA polymerase sigma-70 factor (ECF subfamily)